MTLELPAQTFLSSSVDGGMLLLVVFSGCEVAISSLKNLSYDKLILLPIVGTC
jgi:hypothetical protein